MDFNMRIHPDDGPMFQMSSKAEVEEKDATASEETSAEVVANAELALHKSGCQALCGLHFSEPEEYLTVYITSKARVADALKVPLYGNRQGFCRWE
jgi:hypothetical protein